MPQLCIPRILGDPRFSGHLARRAAIYEARAKEACRIFQGIPGLKDVAYIKYLFGHEVSRDRESQIVVTLRPTRVNAKAAAQPALAEALPPNPKKGIANGTPQLEPPSAPDMLMSK